MMTSSAMRRAKPLNRQNCQNSQEKLKQTGDPVGRGSVVCFHFLGILSADVNNLLRTVSSETNSKVICEL